MSLQITREKVLESPIVWAGAVATCAGLILGVAHYRNDIAAWFRSEPVKVHGTVTSGGRPVVGSHVLVLMNGSGARRQTTTDSRGQFTLSASNAGDYLATFGMSPALPSATRDLTFVWGQNEFNIDLLPTRVKVRVRLPTNEPQPSAVQLALWGPGDRSAQRLGGVGVSDREASAEYVGLDYGDYLLTAFSGGRELVSASPVRFTLDALHSVAEAELGLTRRQLHLQVMDSKGHPAQAATVSSITDRARRLDSGQFDASGVPAGQLMTVTAPGFLPVCTHAANEGTQRVVLRDKSDQLANLKLKGPSRPVGFIYGLPGSDCGVSVGLLDLKWQATGEESVGVRIEGLPRGSYEFRAQEWIPGVTFSVPGGVVEYLVPSYCKFCGG